MARRIDALRVTWAHPETGERLSIGVLRREGPRFYFDRLPDYSRAKEAGFGTPELDQGEHLSSQSTRDTLQYDGGIVTWWTFAGGRINQTLKYALEWKGGWKVIPDNFAIKIQGDSVTPDAVLDVLKPMRNAAFWEAVDTRQKLRSLVPEYRLSKFQQVLPDRWQTEMVGGYLLDFEGAARVLGS